MGNRYPLLSFEEFSEKQVSGSGSFDRFFTGDNAGLEHKLKPVFQRCLKAHPERLTRLTQKLELMCRFVHDHEMFLDTLYQAYVLMHPYAKSNKVLFDLA